MSPTRSLTLLLICAALAGCGGRRPLDVTVVDAETNEPLVRATVSVDSPQLMMTTHPRMQEHAVTDSAGRASVAHVNGRPTFLSVYRAGYFSFHTVIGGDYDDKVYRVALGSSKSHELLSDLAIFTVGAANAQRVFPVSHADFADVITDLDAKIARLNKRMRTARTSSEFDELKRERDLCTALLSAALTDLERLEAAAERSIQRRP